MIHWWIFVLYFENAQEKILWTHKGSNIYKLYSVKVVFYYINDINFLAYEKLIVKLFFGSFFEYTMHLLLGSKLKIWCCVRKQSLEINSFEILKTYQTFVNRLKFKTIKIEKNKFLGDFQSKIFERSYICFLVFWSAVLTIFLKQKKRQHQSPIPKELWLMITIRLFKHKYLAFSLLYLFVGRCVLNEK